MDIEGATLNVPSMMRLEAAERAERLSCVPNRKDLLRLGEYSESQSSMLSPLADCR